MNVVDDKMLSKANARKKAFDEHMRNVGVKTMPPELALMFKIAFNIGWNARGKEIDGSERDEEKHLLLCHECASYQRMTIVNGNIVCDICGSRYERTMKEKRKLP